MAEKARERLGKAPNVSVFVEDGQALSFADCSFDVILCNLGLMFFPDPVRGLTEFRRVLRPGGRVAVSVNTVVERSYNCWLPASVQRPQIICGYSQPNLKPDNTVRPVRFTEMSPTRFKNFWRSEQ